MARDLEDVLDDAVVASARFCHRHAWAASDRLFKLISWLLVIGALTAFYQKTDATVLFVASLILTFLWFAATLATIIDFVCFIQDRLPSPTSGVQVKRPWLLLLVACLITLVAVVVVVDVLLPFLGELFLAVIAAVGAPQ